MGNAPYLNCTLNSAEELSQTSLTRRVNGGNRYSDVAISPAQTIDYDLYSYVINWRPVAAATNLQLCGFRLFYYQPVVAYLPMIRR
jgi:hypothetical protein